MYYVIDKDDKLAIFDDNKEKLEATREFMPQLLGQYTLETDIVTAEELRQHPNKVIIDDVEIEIEVPDELNSLTVEQLNDSENDTNLSTVQPINYSTELEISTHTETRPVQQQVGSHTETITVKGLVPNPNWEKEQAEKERQRLDNLTLTPSDVERALYKAKQMDFEDLKALIAEKAPQLDMKALAIEFRANNFYRGVEVNGMRLIDTVGALLGYSPSDMDYLFEHKELPPQVENEEVNF